MGNPLFSCVVAVKGARPFLDAALGSLAAQDMGDALEVIVQDGDAEPDSGQSDAFNRGFAKARGEWLFWLNSDDLLLPGALTRVCDAIRRNPSARWIAGNQLFIDESGNVVSCSVGNSWHSFLYRHAVPHVYGPSSFFHSSLLSEAGGFDPSLDISMDWDLWIRFMKAGARFKRIDRYLWAQRRWSGSKTQREVPPEEQVVQSSELKRMLEKNGFDITSAGVRLSRIWRILNGNYLKEWRDGLRFRGRKAEECVR